MFINVPYSLEKIPDKPVEREENIEMLNKLHPADPIISLNGEVRLGPFFINSYICLFLATAVIPRKIGFKNKSGNKYVSVESRRWKFNLN